VNALQVSVERENARIENTASLPIPTIKLYVNPIKIKKDSYK